MCLTQIFGGGVSDPNFRGVSAPNLGGVSAPNLGGCLLQIFGGGLLQILGGGQCAAGTHPTGMHSFCLFFFIMRSG